MYLLTSIPDFSCSEPLHLSGRSFLSLTDPLNTSSLCDHKFRSPQKNDWDHPTALRSTLNACGILLIIGTAVLVVIYHIQRRRSAMHSTQTQAGTNVRYMKASTEPWGGFASQSSDSDVMWLIFFIVLVLISKVP